MNYDRYALKTWNIDPQKWDWFNRDYSRYLVSTQSIPANNWESPASPAPHAPVPSGRPFRSALLITGLAIAALYVAVTGVLLAALQDTPSGVLLGLVVTAAMVLAALLCCLPKGAFRLLGALALGVSLSIGLSNLGIGNTVIGAYFFATPLMSFIPAAFIAKSFPRRGSDAYTPAPTTGTSPQSAQRFHPAPGSIFGKPGTVGDATEVFSKEALEAGVEGEKRTATLLSFLLKIPGTSVFHGLFFPGSRVADVDHAVSHGNTVYLIDSKMYRGSSYEWSYDGENDLVVGPGVQSKKNSMAAAAKGYRDILGYGVNVVPIVIIHGRNVRIGSRRWSHSGVGLFTADEAMDYIGTQMAGSLTKWKDNPQVRSTLIDNLKSFI